ncbi:MAG TPA: tRNA (adenosine(37)-N6)-threonylcarbamoyltransferase complex transferase subunit TsaD [Feifaniaceae bacterium]|nr:tRNA (adenosine(37)-N6)-threonylcarbamoyltransferase complex transferase subunit TsaD [Feifaniaceae bacterium]
MTGYEKAASRRARELTEKEHVTVLAIETSCDETAAAVVRDGREVLSNTVYSQIPLHRKYGGVVPELASRNHVLQLNPTVAAALEEAGLSYDEIDAVAVTSRPGLIGALLTGVSYAKGLAYAKGVPLIGVDHIAGHIAANYISCPDLVPPFTCLVASGGHSHIFQVEDYNTLTLLGATKDDAAGEAFDKVARVLGLPYPGGPALEALAKEGGEDAVVFPAGYNSGEGLDFSFSGLKTAVINYLHTAELRGEETNRADVAASFQKSVVDVLTNKAVRAALRQKSRALALAGGVSANRTLTRRLKEAAESANLRFFCPEFKYCTDNAAMIGCAGYYALRFGLRDGLSLNASARR